MFNNCWIVTVSASGNSGKYWLTLSVKCSLPAATCCMTRMAVRFFWIDAIPYRDLAVVGVLADLFAKPNPWLRIILPFWATKSVPLWWLSFARCAICAPSVPDCAIVWLTSTFLIFSCFVVGRFSCATLFGSFRPIKAPNATMTIKPMPKCRRFMLSPSWLMLIYGKPKLDFAFG